MSGITITVSFITLEAFGIFEFYFLYINRSNFCFTRVYELRRIAGFRVVVVFMHVAAQEGSFSRTRISF
jgi:hypothetical protein